MAPGGGHLIKVRKKNDGFIASLWYCRYVKYLFSEFDLKVNSIKKSGNYSSSILQLMHLS